LPELANCAQVLPYAGRESLAPMKTPTEIELKLAVSRQDLSRLQRRLARFGEGEKKAVDNVYYDTAGHLLAQQRMALRVRRIGRRWLQTLKTEAVASALSQRGEWEVPAPGGRLDPARFADTPLAALLRKHPQAPLRPVFRTHFARTLWQAADGAIEIALDEGEIVASDQTAPILELELELKAGTPAALYRLALDLAGKGRSALALRPAVESKAARGYRLAVGRSPAPQKANARALVGHLAGETPLGQALRAVVERGATLLLVNSAGFDEAADPEFVHQARVAVRRMRSAARLLGKPAGWPTAFDDELRWIARAFGAVRDWDVLQSQTLPALPAAAQLPSLAAQVSQQRSRDEQALREVVASARLARLVLQLLRWVQTPADASPTLAAAAGAKLARLHGRLFAAATFFVALPARKQHRVRIHAKRLRYALDLFAGALPARAAARYGKRLAQLQDELGALNDAVVASTHLQRLARTAGVEIASASAWLDEQRLRHALQAEAALAELARMPVPWR
jgi:inorganic triphosphatase YgiF